MRFLIFWPGVLDDFQNKLRKFLFLFSCHILETISPLIFCTKVFNIFGRVYSILFLYISENKRNKSKNNLPGDN